MRRIPLIMGAALAVCVTAVPSNADWGKQPLVCKFSSDWANGDDDDDFS